MERLIELFINTEDGEFYDRGGLLAAYDPAINAGELVRLTVQLCAGVPAFNSAGVLLNPDTTFAGTLAAAETIIDNNFNWYDKGTLLENLTTGTAISELSVASEASPRQLGAVRLNAGTVVNFCGWTATEGGYRLTLADNEFNPAQFTPPVDFAQGAAVEVLEQPIVVSAQNDDSGRATGLFTGLLDAANPVYESMIEGHEDIPGCRIEFSIYQDGRAVFRARRYFDCLGAMAMNKGAAYVHSDSWREADSRYIKLVDWQAPPEYQFSEDGTTWHDQQLDADLYDHERRPGGQWGGAVKMKPGPTGAAAGFGTPTIAVETLPAGSNATASVTASGDNTAKVFNFNFGIPKGADGSGTGDMLKSVYDTDDDGIVDHAATADAVGATTAAQVADAVGKAHAHANKATLDKLAETDGKLTFDGAEIGGGSGTVKSVNGQLPDESGNVTVETGGAVDESRLLPENPANGDIPCYNATATTGGGNDANTKVLLHFDELPFTDTAAGNTSPAAATNSGVTLDTNNFKFGTASAKFANGSDNLKVAVPKALMMSSPWLVDCWFKVDDGQWGDYLRIFTQDDEQDGGWTYYLISGNRVGVWVRNVTPDEPTSAALTPDDWHYATLVYYNAKFYGFVDGVRFTVQDGSAEGFLDYIMLGKRIQSTSYSLRGNIDEFRLQLLDESEISKWIGATIPVPDAPYSKPQTVGEWGKLNKSELVQSVNGQTPDSSGAVTLPEATASAAGLMAAADKAAIAGLTAQGIYPNAAVAAAGSGIDYNLFKTQGTFYIPYHTAVSNGPVSAGSNGVYPGGFLSILQANLSGGTSVQQIFHQHASNNAYIRSYNGDLDIWTDWQRTVTDTDWYSQRVTSASDFNEYKTPGGYFFYAAAHLNSPDAPNNTAGWLVIETVSSGEYVKQTYYALNARKTYIRTYNNNNHTWLSWHQQLSIADITEFKARPGYFKLPGGMIVQWGAATITGDGLYQVTFPIAFPNAIFIGNATAVSGTASASGVVISISEHQTNRMTLITKNHPGSDQDINVHWLAIGY